MALAEISPVYKIKLGLLGQGYLNCSWFRLKSASLWPAAVLHASLLPVSRYDFCRHELSKSNSSHF